MKIKAASEIGIKATHIRLSRSTTESEVSLLLQTAFAVAKLWTRKCDSILFGF